MITLCLTDVVHSILLREICLSWNNLDFAARIVSFLIHLNLNGDAFLQFLHMRYDADVSARLGMEGAEGLYGFLERLAAKSAEALVNEQRVHLPLLTDVAQRKSQ